MATDHSGGNIQNSILIEEHDGGSNAKRTSLASAATIYAVVNTGAAGVQNSMATLFPGPNYIGLVTTHFGTGVATLAPSPNFIGLVSVAQPLNALATIYPRTDYIGLMSISGNVAFSGNVTIEQITRALPVGANYIGLASVNIGGTLPALAAGAAYAGLMTVDIGSNRNVAIVGNITLANSQGYIGLVTNTPVGLHTLAPSPNFIGLVSIAQPISTTFSGNVTLDAGSRTGIAGNLTLADPRGFIGLVSAVPAANVTLNPSAAFIGLTTTVPDFGSNVTVYTQVVSANGNTTIFVAPASNRFFLTNLHVASLGRSEVEIRSGATTLIPFTGLPTIGGYTHNFNQPGLPSRAQADALVVNLNGAATISIMVSWYARP